MPGMLSYSMSYPEPGIRMLSVRLPVELNEAVEAVATDEGLSKSDLVREALESRTFLWQQEHLVQRTMAVAPSLEHLERLLENEVGRIQTLRERTAEHLESLEDWLRYVREQREQATSAVRSRVAGGLRASLDQRRMQLEEEQG